MLTIANVRDNTIFRAYTPNETQALTLPNNNRQVKAYLERNRDVYTDFADGDISLLSFLKDKIRTYWNLFTKKPDPILEIKAKMIEEEIKDLVKTKHASSVNYVA
ncbi:MAG: hypothetical protein PHX18_07445 [Candidatus Gastranaerophilales bacterium]|nr:hypothetical protein [Candidatus Gastranaerophilales bacterium]